MFFHAEILPQAELFWQILVKTEREEITLFCSCQSLTIYFTLITFQFSHFEAGVWQVDSWRWEGCWQLELVFLPSMWESIQYDWITSLWNGTSSIEDGLKFWQSEYLKSVFTVTVLMAKTSETGNCNSCCWWSWSLQHSLLGEPTLFSQPPEKELKKKKRSFCAVMGKRWRRRVPPTVSR